MTFNRIETELVAISRQLKSSTVDIIDSRSCGSGVIWSTDGLIITNAHVLRRAEVNVRLNDETLVRGGAIAIDARRDLAAIKINAKQLPVPKIGNAQLLRTGEIVLAMGNPWGFRDTLTMGVIYATGWNKTERGVQVKAESNASFIVADLRLASGNSGGILANARGEVIGINVAIFGGLALAIPSQQVEDFVGAIAR